MGHSRLVTGLLYLTVITFLHSFHIFSPLLPSLSSLFRNRRTETMYSTAGYSRSKPQICETAILSFLPEPFSTKGHRRVIIRLHTYIKIIPTSPHIPPPLLILSAVKRSTYKWGHDDQLNLHTHIQISVIYSSLLTGSR